MPSRHRRRTKISCYLITLEAGSGTYRMSFQLFTSHSTICFTQHSIYQLLIQEQIADIPSNEIFSFSTKMDVIREEQVAFPIDNLSVYVMSVLGTEWGVAFHQHCLTLKQAREQDDLPTRHSNMIAPRDHQSHSFPYPCCKKISGEICHQPYGQSFSGTGQKTYIVRGTNSRISQLPPISLPSSDIILRSHLQINSIDHD